MDRDQERNEADGRNRVRKYESEEHREKERQRGREVLSESSLSAIERSDGRW
jgi:hypothetical protein